MSKPSRFFSTLWLLAPLAALTFLVWIDSARIRRVERTSLLVQEAPKTDLNSVTGYAGDTRVLVVPEHNQDTYHWIAQTQQMFATGAARVHRIDYENAPFGREVHATSVYRWWLGAVAWMDHVVSGRPIGQSVERAAVYADPLVHVLLLIALAAFVFWRFGAWPAAVVSVGLVALYPLGAEYLPGMTDERGLALAVSIISSVMLLAGIRVAYTSDNGSRTASLWFAGAGIVGALSLWTSTMHYVVVLVGTSIGGIIAAALARRGSSSAGSTPPAPLPWRWWALAGAVTTLVATFAEFAPHQLGSWQLHAIHPLFGIAWLGLGELLTVVSHWISRGKSRPRVSEMIGLTWAIIAIAAIPVTLRLTHDLGFLQADLSWSRLVRLPGGVTATSSLAWLTRDGLTAVAWATLLPLLIVGPVLWVILRRGTDVAARTSLAVTLGPVLVSLVFAGRYLSGWNIVDGTLLPLLIALAAAVAGAVTLRKRLWIGAGLGAVVLVPGVLHIVPKQTRASATALNEWEVYGLVERDLARWLAAHRGAVPPVALAPNQVNATLYFYGGIKGMGGLSWENQDGVGAAVRIASASTPEEAKELIDRRGITHIVMPSWDSYLDVYARMGMGQLEGTFLNRLHLWQIPPWLRPVPYQLPTIAGFENQTLTIFEVVEDQDDAVALSRIAEFFVETGQLDRAALAGQALRKFPADIGALVARGQVELARSDAAGFAKTSEQLKTRMRGGADRTLLWDRRVGLAVVFARAKQNDLAREQVRRCLETADELQLRALPTGALYRLMVLGRAFGLSFSDPQLQSLALELLPLELRVRLTER